MTGSWARKLYIENAKIYQPVLENGLKKAPREVQGLIRQFRNFHVPSQGRVLDVSCGIGRHSIYLAKRRYTVVGYDPSAPFLARASQLARRMRLSKDKIRFYCGKPADIRKTLDQGEEAFDAIISMDYSFGYSTRKDDVRLFKSLHKLANRKCVLVIETGNRNFWLKHFQRFFHESFPDGLERHTTFSFDERRNLLKSNWEFYRKLRTKSLKHLLSIQVAAIIYSKESLGRVVSSAGWMPVKTFENIDHPRKVSDSLPFFFMIALRK
jgi:SAM-dependent methyltransferase